MLTSTLAAGALLIHGRFAESLAGSQITSTQSDAMLNAWLKISRDNTITIISSQAEMGQGIQTTLPAALVDELGADWSRVRLENAPADPAYRNPRINWQFTGNSESTTAFFDLMREMGAAGRQMLIGAAANEWKVDPATCQHALRQARTLARNLRGTPRAYRYRTRGQMATLGSRHGVALVGSWRVRGLPGWLIARGYHLLQLPFASRRLRVLSDWTTAALFRRDVSGLSSIRIAATESERISS